jgi:hypothetical protein
MPFFHSVLQNRIGAGTDSFFTRSRSPTFHIFYNRQSDICCTPYKSVDKSKQLLGSIDLYHRGHDFLGLYKGPTNYFRNVGCIGVKKNI